MELRHSQLQKVGLFERIVLVSIHSLKSFECDMDKLTSVLGRYFSLNEICQPLSAVGRPIVFDGVTKLDFFKQLLAKEGLGIENVSKVAIIGQESPHYHKEVAIMIYN